MQHTPYALAHRTGAAAGHRLMGVAGSVSCCGIGAGGRPGNRASKAPEWRPVALGHGYSNVLFVLIPLPRSITPCGNPENGPPSLHSLGIWAAFGPLSGTGSDRAERRHRVAQHLRLLFQR